MLLENQKTTRFFLLECGDVFIYKNELFMKTQKSTINEEMDSFGIKNNSVKLKSGVLKHIPNNEFVDKVSGKFIYI